MHREFCTLFDTNYAFKAVAMYRSLQRHCDSFRLTAFLFDEGAKELIDRMELPGVETVSLPELESFDAELLSVKGDRTRVEYCWTSTPALPLYVFDAHPEAREVTYVDADMLFFSSPEPLYEEMGDASVMITPHRYAPAYAYEEAAGTYNVSFMVFRRTEDGMACLQWWHDRCIEWCYFRYEDGKIGDQGYLNEFPKRFDGVHVLEHPGGGLAPWNLTNYEITRSGDRVMVDDVPLVFCHYHHFALGPKGRPRQLAPPNYHVPRAAKKLVYRPYVDALHEAIAEIRAFEPGFSAGFADRAPTRQRLQNLLLNARARVSSRRAAPASGGGAEAG
jgi:hypothetical protein